MSLESRNAHSGNLATHRGVHGFASQNRFWFALFGVEVLYGNNNIIRLKCTQNVRFYDRIRKNPTFLALLRLAGALC